MTSGVRNPFPAGPLSRSSEEGTGLIFLVLILGLLLRLYAGQQTGIINSDGAIYIHQARAIYYGLWDAVNSCTLTYPSITTLSIAAFYGIFGDWVTAAIAVSIFYGTLTFIALFLLAARFFDRETSALITLIYAMTPVLVDGSIDITRDPAYWLFAVLGLYFLSCQKRHTALFLLLSSLSLILATWTRVESFVMIAVAVAYLFLDGRKKPVRRALIFLLPVMAVLAAAIGSQLWLHPGRINWYRLAEIPDRAAIALSQYDALRANLAELASHPPLGIPAEFFDNVRDILWLVGFGVIFQNILETYFYPFFLIHLMGLGNIRQKIGRDRRVLYFCLLVPAAFLLLYFYLFHRWEMENRWFALALFPSFIFLGYGLEKLIAFVQAKFNMRKGMALALIGLLILAFTLPKNMKAREEDKVIFKNIGEVIASLEGNAKKIEILTVGSSSRWISFYANVRFPGAPCPDEYRDYANGIGKDYDQFLDRLKTGRIRYLVWEEKNWPADRFDFLNSPHERDFIRIGAWSHPDTGRIILFKLR